MTPAKAVKPPRPQGRITGGIPTDYSGKSEALQPMQSRKDIPHMSAAIPPTIDATARAGQKLDPVTYMAEEPESEELQAADRDYSRALSELQKAAPAELQALILRVEEAANWWASLQEERFFYGGLELGLCPDRRKC